MTLPSSLCVFMSNLISPDTQICINRETQDLGDQMQLVISEEVISSKVSHW